LISTLKGAGVLQEPKAEIERIEETYKRLGIVGGQIPAGAVLIKDVSGRLQYAPGTAPLEYQKLAHQPFAVGPQIFNWFTREAVFPAMEYSQKRIWPYAVQKYTEGFTGLKGFEQKYSLPRAVEKWAAPVTEPWNRWLEKTIGKPKEEGIFEYGFKTAAVGTGLIARGAYEQLGGGAPVTKKVWIGGERYISTEPKGGLKPETVQTIGTVVGYAAPYVTQFGVAKLFGPGLLLTTAKAIGALAFYGPAAEAAIGAPFGGPRGIGAYHLERPVAALAVDIALIPKIYSMIGSAFGKAPVSEAELSRDLEREPKVRHSSRVIITDEKGNTLFEIDAKSKQRLSPGGAINRDTKTGKYLESPSEAALREAKEELGLKLSAKDLSLREIVTTESEKYYVYEYQVKNLKDVLNTAKKYLATDPIVDKKPLQEEISGYSIINMNKYAKYAGRTAAQPFGPKTGLFKDITIRSDDLYLVSRINALDKVEIDYSALTKAEKLNTLKDAKMWASQNYGVEAIKDIPAETLIKDYLLSKQEMNLQMLYIPREGKPPILLGPGSRYNVPYTSLKEYTDKPLEYVHGTQTGLKPDLPFGKTVTVREEFFKRGTGDKVLFFHPPTVPAAEGKLVVYHGTTNEAAQKILSEGLQPAGITGITRKGGMLEGETNVFLSSSKEVAQSFAGKGGTVLEIHLTPEQLSKADILDLSAGKEIMIKGNIPAEQFS